MSDQTSSQVPASRAFPEELGFDELADPALVKNGPEHIVEICMKIILMKHYGDNPKDNRLTRSDNGRSRISSSYSRDWQRSCMPNVAGVCPHDFCFEHMRLLD